MVSITSSGKPGPSSAIVTSSSECAPFSLDLDSRPGKVGRIFDDIAEPVDHARPALDDRLGRARRRRIARRPSADREPDAARAIGLGRLLEHGAHADTRACRGSCSLGRRVSFCRISRQRCAWVRSKRDVLAQRAVGGKLALELLRHDRDRRQRRAELVRGGGGETIERVQLLLARQHEVGRGQAPPTSGAIPS